MSATGFDWYLGSSGTLSGGTLDGSYYSSAFYYTSGSAGSFLFDQGNDNNSDGDDDALQFTFSGTSSTSLTGTYAADSADSGNQFYGYSGTFTATKN